MKERLWITKVEGLFLVLKTLFICFCVYVFYTFFIVFSIILNYCDNIGLKAFKSDILGYITKTKRMGISLFDLNVLFTVFIAI